MSASVLSFVRKLLNLQNIQSYIINLSFKHLDDLDLGLRKNILKINDTEYMIQNLINNCKDNVVYYLTDIYCCNYCFIKLPVNKYGDKNYFVIGPYVFENIDNERFLQISEELKFTPEIAKQLKEYYNYVTFIRYESEFKTIISALASEMFGGDDKFEIEFWKNQLWNDKNYLDYTDLEKPSLYANLIEQRYSVENELMNAVSRGNTASALELLSKFSNLKIQQRFEDPIRDIKNRLIILNSLFRKSAETGYVHPVHIDKVSGDFARKIEKLTSLKSADNMKYEMARKYCMLVKNYSLRGYSIIIQKAINYIDLNLNYNLSLKIISKAIDVNASYLSTLFKKETNFTITEYIHTRRIESSLFFLNTTNMQIQNIAAHVGILDVNYFTKIFKKVVGKTPKEYREMIIHK